MEKVPSAAASSRLYMTQEIHEGAYDTSMGRPGSGAGAAAAKVCWRESSKGTATIRGRTVWESARILLDHWPFQSETAGAHLKGLARVPVVPQVL